MHIKGPHHQPHFQMLTPPLFTRAAGFVDVDGELKRLEKQVHMCSMVV
jgi:hypothetical protein